MSVYKVIELVGTSGQSWEDAAMTAVKKAKETLRDLRVAEVIEQDLTVGADGAVESFRTKLKLSFKFEQPWDQTQQRAAERPTAATQ